MLYCCNYDANKFWTIKLIELRRKFSAALSNTKYNLEYNHIHTYIYRMNVTKIMWKPIVHTYTKLYLVVSTFVYTEKKSI